MIDTGYYLLKVILCSGLLFLYYHLALRNKLFHQWNRFYLLLSMALSLVLPAIHLSFWQPQGDSNAIKLLQVVTAADEYVAKASDQPATISTVQIISFSYAFITILLLGTLLSSLYTISKLIASHKIQPLHHMRFIYTEAKGTPFSFFRYIFWNPQIDMQTATGQAILKHEMVHVQEKHSWDKLFIQLVLIVYWCNPFFWLIRKELYLIHEFIADEKAVADGQTPVLAAMLLQTTYPKHFQQLINPFFQSSIKRRLAMLTKSANPKISYISRLLVLPLLPIIGFAFTIKSYSNNSPSIYQLSKDMTVVIDAGHGGHLGANKEGIYEDDINLAIAQQVALLSKNSQLKVILSRDNDNEISLQQRVQVAKDHQADLFISLHVNAAEKSDSSGISVLIPKNETPFMQQSKVFSSLLVQQLSGVYTTQPYLGQRTTGIWVLDHNNCPAVMIECGYMTNQQDLNFISNTINQKKIAEQIVKAIAAYSAYDNNVVTVNTTTELDTVPKQYIDGKEIKSINVNTQKKQSEITTHDGSKTVQPADGSGRLEITFTDGTQKTITINEAKKIGLLAVPPPPPPAMAPPPPPSKMGTPPPPPAPAKPPVKDKAQLENPLVIIDDVEKGKLQELGKIDELVPADEIISIHVWKGADAIKKYGAKGKEGVIEIATKSKINTATSKSS